MLYKDIFIGTANGNSSTVQFEESINVCEVVLVGSSSLVTVTGGELRDAMDVKAANATAQASTIGVNTGDQRGYPGNTTGYYVFTNPGAQTANVVIHVSWEEVI